MDQVIVRKLDHAGRPVISYPAEVLCRGDRAIVLRASWDRDPMDLGFVVLEPQDRWMEIFYSNRWYNIFEIRTSDGRLKGWYCNITRPAHIGEDEVAAEDLALDLWVEPDGSIQVLDEEEFAELGLGRAERRAARNAVAELRARVARKRFPFHGSWDPESSGFNAVDCLDG